MRQNVLQAQGEHLGQGPGTENLGHASKIPVTKEAKINMTAFLLFPLT
jgi:hypothetical protein